ncbi:MAG: M23 family metallopeptidase [Butyricicoccus sp.]
MSVLLAHFERLRQPYLPFHGKEFHDGVDLARQAAHQSSRSARHGHEVRLIRGYGNYISIDHGGGLMSFYGHASALYVKQGAKVTAGQKIAAVGTTGSSTGCHLHFGMHKNGSSSIR